jgi:hypothetical protein
MTKLNLKKLVFETIGESLDVVDNLDEAAPPYFPKELVDKIIKQYGDTPETYEKMWKIYKKYGNKIQEMWIAWENKNKNTTMKMSELKQLIGKIVIESMQEKVSQLGPQADIQSGDRNAKQYIARGRVEKEAVAPNKKTVHSISKPEKDTNTGEWVVKWMTNGKRDEAKTYYTDDKQDAIDTMKEMIKHAIEMNKGQSSTNESEDDVQQRDRNAKKYLGRVRATKESKQSTKKKVNEMLWTTPEIGFNRYMYVMKLKNKKYNTTDEIKSIEPIYAKNEEEVKQMITAPFNKNIIDIVDVKITNVGPVTQDDIVKYNKDREATAKAMKAFGTYD